MTTKIEWATHTSNWLAGCTRVSPACSHCYAETMSARLATMPQAPQRYRDGVVEGRRWTGEVSYDAAALASAFEELRRAKRPRRVFINSMSDTFHEHVPASSLEDLARYIRAAEVGGDIGATGHVIMLLTKRPERMLAWQRAHFPDGLPAWVWVGTTVEDQAWALKRVPHLLEVYAQVRFLSVEPMLGPVDIERFGAVFCPWCVAHVQVGDEVEECPRCNKLLVEDQYYWHEGIRWVIAGCESGAKRRETSIHWLRDLRGQCQRTGVSFFLKQADLGDGVQGLPELDGRTWAEVPPCQS